MSGEPIRAYVICTVPRSGSTLLCRMLSRTGVAGEPGSHFHEPDRNSWQEEHGLGGMSFATETDLLRAVLKAAIAQGKGASGIFGLRMQHASFAYFLQELGRLWPEPMSDVGRIEAAFGRTLFIHLTRPDRLGQAISRLRAEQTGLWHRHADGTELERTAPPQESRYDRGAILRHMAEAEAADAGWTRWFAEQSVEPLRIRYDALERKPQDVLAVVLAALQLDPGRAQAVETPTARLADDISREWRRRFEAGD